MLLKGKCMKLSFEIHVFIFCMCVYLHTHMYAYTHLRLLLCNLRWNKALTTTSAKSLQRNGRVMFLPSNPVFLGV